MREQPQLDMDDIDTDEEYRKEQEEQKIADRKNGHFVDDMDSDMPVPHAERGALAASGAHTACNAQAARDEETAVEARLGLGSDDDVTVMGNGENYGINSKVANKYYSKNCVADMEGVTYALREIEAVVLENSDNNGHGELLFMGNNMIPRQVIIDSGFGKDNHFNTVEAITDINHHRCMHHLENMVNISHDINELGPVIDYGEKEFNSNKSPMPSHENYGIIPNNESMALDSTENNGGSYLNSNNVPKSDDNIGTSCVYVKSAALESVDIHGHNYENIVKNNGGGLMHEDNLNHVNDIIEFEAVGIDGNNFGKTNSNYGHMHSQYSHAMNTDVITEVKQPIYDDKINVQEVVLESGEIGKHLFNANEVGPVINYGEKGFNSDKSSMPSHVNCGIIPHKDRGVFLHGKEVINFVKIFDNGAVMEGVKTINCSPKSHASSM